MISPAYSFFATAGTISNNGATPVFVDIDPRTYNLDPHRLEAAITPRTKAVVAVSLYGQCCDYDPIRGLCDAHGVALVQDATESLGATASPPPCYLIDTMTGFRFEGTPPIRVDTRHGIGEVRIRRGNRCAFCSRRVALFSK